MALTVQEQEQLNRLLREQLITQEQYNLVVNESITLAQLLENTLEEQKLTSRDIYSISQEVNDELRKSLGINVKRSKQVSDILKTNNDITNAIGKQIKNFSNVAEIEGEIAKNKNLQKKAEAQIQNLVGDRTQQIDKIVSKNNLIASLNDKLITADEEQAAKLKEKIHFHEQLNQQLINSLNPREKSALLMATQVDNIEKQNEALKNQAKEVEEINDRLGASGGIVSGLEKGLNKLGLSSLGDGFTKVKADLAEAESEVDEFGNKVNSKGDLMSKAFSGSLDVLKKGFKDPLILLGLTVKLAKEFGEALFIANENLNQIAKSTGLTNEAIRATNVNIQQVVYNSDSLYINTQRLTESFATLVSQTGMMGVYGGQALETFTELTGQLGLSAQEGERLTYLARLQGKDTEKTMNNIVGVVNNFNKANKSSMNAREIMKDISNVSSEIVVSLGQNPTLLAKAVTEAKALGLSLDQVDKIAEGLLSIESSLQAEMEAEMLIGKELNLERARSLALQGDYLGLTEEIGKQEDILYAFRHGTILQQKAAAKALGLSRKEMADMIMMQDMQKLSQEEFIDAYGEQAYEQMTQLSAQEKINEAMTQFKLTMADTLTTITPLVEGFANLVGFLSKAKPLAYGLIAIFGALATKATVAAIAQIFGGNAKLGPVGLALSGAAVAIMMGLINSNAKKAGNIGSAKDLRMRAGQPAIMSDRLGGLEGVTPAVEDDVVLGPGILDKVEAFEKGKVNAKRPVNISVSTSDKVKSIDTEQIKTDLLNDISEASNIESIATGPIQPTITQSVLESKRATPTSQTIIKESSSSKEMERQNRMMNEQLKSINATLKNIGGKSTDIYFDSEKVERNLQRSTAGFR